MQIYTLMSRLLDYPDAELMASLPEIMQRLRGDPSVSPQEREALQQLIAWMLLHDLTGLQEDYVQTFDMTSEHDLHLTHHLFGDDRGRGPALIDLSEYYKEMGLTLDANEIPDYLPLILEFVATLDEMQARIFLADAAKVLKVLAENLERRHSPYARLIRIVEQRGNLAHAA